MENLLDIVKLLSNNNTKPSTPQEQPIPKEIKDQYPYGDFPIRYTKSGQETIRKQSENRYSYTPEFSEEEKKEDNKSSDMNLSMLLPLIQMMSGGKKQPKDMMQMFAKIFFKDNPDMQKIFNLIPNLTNIKGQEIKSEQEFPDTNKVQISNLKRIN